MVVGQLFPAEYRLGRPHQLARKVGLFRRFGLFRRLHRLFMGAQHRRAGPVGPPAHGLPLGRQRGQQRHQRRAGRAKQKQRRASRCDPAFFHASALLPCHPLPAQATAWCAHSNPSAICPGSDAWAPTGCCLAAWTCPKKQERLAAPAFTALPVYSCGKGKSTRICSRIVLCHFFWLHETTFYPSCNFLRFAV